MLSLLLVVAEVLALAALVLLLHRASPRVGLVPLLAFLSGLAVLTQGTAYVYVLSTEPRIVLNSSAVFVPVILLAVLLLYAIDGTVAARQAVIAIVGLSLLVFFAAGFNRLRVLWLGPESVVSILPGPRTVLDPLMVLASILAFVAGLHAVSATYQFVGNHARRLARLVAPGAALLVGLWVDAAVFSLLYGLLEPPLVGGRLVRDLTGKTAVALLLWPLAVLYVSRAARWRPGLGSGEPRPVFDMLFGLLGRMQSDLARALGDLRQERDLVTRLMATSPVGIVRVDRTGRIAFANDQAEKVLGLSRTDLAARQYDDPAWQITDEDGAPWPAERLPFRRVRDTLSAVYGIRHAITWPSGRRVVVSVNAAPLLDEAGVFDGMVAVVDDVTERRRGEREREALIHELATRNQALQLIGTLAGRMQRRLAVEAIAAETVAVMIRHSEPPSVAFYLLDDDQESLRMLAAHGFTAEERRLGAVLPIRGSLTGLVVRQGCLLHSEDIAQDERLLPALREALAGRGMKACVAIPLAFGGETLGSVNLLFDHAHPLTPIDRETFEAIGQTVALAITNARHLSRLEAKNAELERFTYTVSHDLKSPLVTIQGFLGLVATALRSGDHARIESDLRRIDDAASRMTRLLDELLELSRVGRLMNPPQRVGLETIAHEAIGLIQGRLRVREVEIVVDPGLPLVLGDRTRLVQVMQNLLDNAVKFLGDQPRPRIEVGVRSSGNGAPPVIFVRDNGVGIDPAYHEQVFGLFDKIDARSEGTGVGLALVRRIVETHGGRVWVESDGVGHGACFCFTLPVVQEGTVVDAG